MVPLRMRDERSGTGTFEDERYGIMGEKYGMRDKG